MRLKELKVVFYKEPLKNVTFCIAWFSEAV